MFVMLTGCASAPPKDGEAIIIFKYGDVDVEEELIDEEAATIRNIVKGKFLYFDSPSCGFYKETSIKIGDTYYCLACDECCTVKVYPLGMYFSVSQRERNKIVEIFEAHGGFFPCV